MHLWIWPKCLTQVLFLRLCEIFSYTIITSQELYIFVLVLETLIKLEGYSYIFVSLFLNVALCPQRLQGLLGMGALDGHLDFHTTSDL